MHFVILLVAFVPAVFCADTCPTSKINADPTFDLLTKVGKTFYYCETSQRPDNVDMCSVGFQKVDGKPNTVLCTANYYVTENNKQALVDKFEMTKNEKGWYIYSKPDTVGAVTAVDSHKSGEPADCFYYIKCVGGKAHTLLLCENREHCKHADHSINTTPTNNALLPLRVTMRDYNQEQCKAIGI